MDHNRPCGCKGRRSCLICEAKYGINPTLFITREEKENGYVYCHACQKAWPGWDISDNTHDNHKGESIHFPGVYIQLDFIDETEKNQLLKGMNNEDWDLSVSGRRKQNYGPKCNFKKNKIVKGDFKGFPQYCKFISDKFNQSAILKDYHVIEQCSLEYDPSKGASIDPHIDDCWIWGERIVTVNVLGDTYLTMTKYTGDSKKYNLEQIDNYPPVLNTDGFLLDFRNFELSCKSYLDKYQNCDNNPVVRIFMPERSLIVMYGPARYQWEHCVLREDVLSKRLCLAYREFTPPYLSGGKHENIGKEILELSNSYW